MCVYIDIDIYIYICICIYSCTQQVPGHVVFARVAVLGWASLSCVCSF